MYTCCSVSHSCTNLCNPTDCTMPGFCVLHHLLEFAQTEAHWVSDAIQPSHPLSSPSPPALNFSQHQSLFQWIGSSHQVPRVLELRFSISTSKEYSRLISLKIGLISFLSKGLSRGFSSTTVQKYQFFTIQPFLWSNTCIPIGLLEKPQLWLYRPLLAKWCLCFLIHCTGVMAFFPRSRNLLVSWLQATTAVILETKKIKSVTISIISPSLCHEVMGPNTNDLSFLNVEF